ncbi:MAG: RecQ family zinc-binding domain-containing protein [Polyangiaceae bacterium]
MRESNIRKSSPLLKPRSAKPANAKPASAKPSPSSSKPPRGEPPALRVAEPTLPAGHDDAARVALQKTRSAWIIDGDVERARSRYFDVARGLKRPALFVAASLGSLERDKARLLEQGVRVVLLQPVDGRIARADLEALRNGGPLLVLVTSEALHQEEVLRALERAAIGSVTIDGAELAAERGHEFRPSFARLPTALQRLGKVSLFALSRPVPAAVRREAQQRLGMADTLLVEAPALEPSVLLDTRAVRGERRNATLLEVLAELPRPGVVLCATPHEVDGVCAVLGAERGLLCRVHAGMPSAERAAMLEQFQVEERPALLVTTSALAPEMGIPGLVESPGAEARIGFGSGRTRRDLAFVLHHHAPASLEQYLRELSGLGAGGSPATALMFYDSAHRSMNQAILEQQRLPAHKVEPLARALESVLAAGKPLKLEALALQTGLSRRSSERLLALFVDAGIVRRDKGGLSLLATGDALQASVGALSAALEGLQRGDATRLGAVERYAEASECKRKVLAQRFGGAGEAACGHCSSCLARSANKQRARG